MKSTFSADHTQPKFIFYHRSTRMRKLTLTGLLFVFATTCTGAVEESQLEHITDESGHSLTLNITHKEAEEDIAVFGDNGEPVIKVEIIEHDGYQIDKPANESVCLLSEIEEFENKTLCYNRIDYPAQNVTKKLQDHCEGRDIYVLVPDECKTGEEETAVTGATPSENSGRVKRSRWLGRTWRCYRRSYYTLRCVRVTRCCRWNFIFCTNRCFLRCNWQWVRVTYNTCSYY